MLNLNTVSLSDELPPNLAIDAGVQAVAAALDPSLQALATAMSSANLLGNIATLPGDVVDLLAWQFHVDYYDPALPLDTRRALVQSSLLTHRQAGTRAALQRLLDIVFGVGNVGIQEWFEYGGEPGHIRLISALPLDPQPVEQFAALFHSVAPARVWYEFIVAETINAGEHFGGAVIQVTHQIIR